MRRRQFTLGVASIVATNPLVAESGGFVPNQGRECVFINGIITPECFGASGDGVSDDTTSVIAWAKHGGVLHANPGKTYLCASMVSGGYQLSFPTNTYIEGRGATIRFTETDPSDTQRGVLNAGTTLRDLNFMWSERQSGGAGNYFERFLSLHDDTSLIDVSFTSEFDQPKMAEDSGYDSCVRLDGSNIRMVRVSFDKICRCVDAWAAKYKSNISIIDCEIRLYGSGISINKSRNVTIDGLSVGERGRFAEPEPGQNAITGGGDNLVIRNIVIEGSGEHAIYLSSGGTLDDPVCNLLLENVYVQSSGQCALKLRGWADFVVRNVFGANAHRGSKAGTNEDGLRMEECRDGRIWSFGHGDSSGDGSGGYVGIHIDSCRDILFFDTYVGSVQSAFIRIEDKRVLGSVRGIRMQDISFLNSAKPLLEIAVRGKAELISIVGIYLEEPIVPLVRIISDGEVGCVFLSFTTDLSDSVIESMPKESGFVLQTPSRRYLPSSKDVSSAPVCE